VEEETEARNKELVANIRRLQGPVEDLIRRFQQVVAESEKHQPDVNSQSGDHWRLVAYRDSLLRLNLFLEQNFNYIEPMGLLAVTRYLFELMIWLKLLHEDSRYGLVYYHELLVKQLDYYTKLGDHLTRETALLRDIGEQEVQLRKERLAEARGIADPQSQKQAILQIPRDVMQHIDSAAARSFRLYGDQAQTNGYDYQAHLVETKVLPEVKERIAQMRQYLDVFELEAPQDAKDLVPQRWNWKVQAGRVGMEEEYSFIYSYTSRLLHATPTTTTTDRRNL